MPLELTAPPVAYPVTLGQARDWLNQSDGDNRYDALIMSLVGAFTRRAESITGRSFVQREYLLTLERFDFEITLLRPPIVSVESVEYLAGDGTPTVIDPSSYELGDGVLRPSYGTPWPTDVRRSWNAVQVAYTAGYPGTNVAPNDSPPNSPPPVGLLPEELSLWIRYRLASAFKDRESIITGTIVEELPRSQMDSLLDGLILGTRFG